MQKQYRPPIDMVAVEIPAGLVDAGESPEVCAVRELKEETGYVGVAEQTSTVMYNGGCIIDSRLAAFYPLLQLELVYGVLTWVFPIFFSVQTPAFAIPILIWSMSAWTCLFRRTRIRSLTSRIMSLLNAFRFR